MDKSFDIIVFGATSFVGKILSQYLFDQFGNDGIRWALAGRSESKLQQLRTDLGTTELPILIADASDKKALINICQQARVIISTVGPYALFGEPLIAACCETGTDYCDLTGEAQWIKRMQDRYESKAKGSGARIVHCCGFDSIPSDLGVYFLQQQAQAHWGKPCTDIKMRVKKMKGGASGGTVASIINVTKEAVKDPALRKELMNPYSTCPTDHEFTVRQNDVTVSYDDSYQSWLAPFVMAAINTRVVHRSNALSNNSYGKDFRYEEAMLTGPGTKGRITATMISAGLKSFIVGAALKPSRWFIERFIVPKPGEGPSPKEQLEGHYNLDFIGTTDSGEKLRVVVTGDRDPGYGSTSKMLGQAAACIAFDLEEKKAGGFWTPSTLLGSNLIERLRNDAGLTFSEEVM